MLIADMDFQPRYDAQASSPFFSDGRAMRTPPVGTVPFGGADYESDAGSPRQDRDFLRDDDRYYRGKQGDAWIIQNPLRIDRALLAAVRSATTFTAPPATARPGRARES
jgi:hypothetical protein